MKKNYKDKGWLKFQYVTLNRNPEDIAKECDIDTVSIFRQLRDFDLLKYRKSVKKLGEHPTYQNRDWLYEQYVTRRKTFIEIAKECKVKDEAIYRWAKKHNINIRGSRMRMWSDKKWLKHQLLDLGYSVDEIAKSQNTTKATIWHWMRKYGIKIKKDIPKYKDKKWLNHQYLTLNKSTCKIANEYGVGNSTISIWLKKLEIPIKPKAIRRLKGKGKYADEKWLRKEYLKHGKSTKEIAKQINVSQATVNKWIKKFDIREKKIYLFQNEEWLWGNYWGQNKTIEEISKEFGIGTTSLYRWMKKYDIPRRKHYDYKSPSGLETQLSNFLQENKLPFKYVGNDASEKLDTSKLNDVQWNIIYPDFKHEKKKIAIEIGDKKQKTNLTQKTPYDDWKEYEKMRKSAYNKLGWIPIIIWADEFNNYPDKVLNKIRKLI